MQQIAEDFYTKNINYLGSGMCFWLMMLLLVINISIRGFKHINIFLPSILVWGTLMIASPISFGFRYSFFYVLVLPIFFIVTFIKFEVEESEYNISKK